MILKESKSLEIATQIVTAAVSGCSNAPMFDATGGKRLGDFFREVYDAVFLTIEQHDTKPYK